MAPTEVTVNVSLLTTESPLISNIFAVSAEETVPTQQQDTVTTSIPTESSEESSEESDPPSLEPSGAEFVDEEEDILPSERNETSSFVAFATTRLSLQSTPSLQKADPLSLQPTPSLQKADPLSLQPTPSLQKADPLSLQPTPSLQNADAISNQQQLLNEWLHLTMERQRNALKKPLIIYNVHPQSGVGNMMRGVFTTVLFSVVTKKAFASCTVRSH